MGKGRRNGICFHFWMRNKTWLRAIKKHLKVLHRTRVVDHIEGWQHGRSGEWSGFLQESWQINVWSTFVQLSLGNFVASKRKKYLRVHYWGEEGRKAKAAKWTQRPALLLSLLTFESSLQVVERYQCNLRTGEDFLKTLHRKIQSVFTTLNWKSVGNVSQTPGCLRLWTACSKDSVSD